MTSRPRRKVVGQQAWIVNHEPYPTPVGLVDRQQVLLVADHGMEVVVRDQQKEWTLLHWQISAGLEFQAKTGEWYSEELPAVRRAVVAEIERMRAKMAAEPDYTRQGFIDGGIRVLQDCLDRHPECDPGSSPPLSPTQGH